MDVQIALQNLTLILFRNNNGDTMDDHLFPFEIGHSGNDPTTLNVSLIPLAFRQMSSNSRLCVLAYICLFILAVGGNVSVFVSVVRQIHRLKVKTRITLLILHLSIADLIVTFFLIPMEIFWRISIQWYGGNLLCKLCQFLRPFGLYLSSMVIIAISLDRYFAINHPLRIDGKKMVRWMLGAAWVTAIICSLPQTVIFSVKVHPVYPSFKNCVSIGYFNTAGEEILYNVMSILVMYFAPLVVIIFSYSLILRKIIQKSREQKQVLKSVTASLIHRRSVDIVFANKSTRNVNPMTAGTDKDASRCKDAGRKGRVKPVLSLRCSGNGGSTIKRARNRTLCLTLIIVLVFILCSTPYILMVLWYMFDREGATQVDEGVQDILFMMAVGNSVANPLIYGSCTKGCSVFCGLNGIPAYFRRKPQVCKQSTWITLPPPVKYNSQPLKF